MHCCTLHHLPQCSGTSSCFPLIDRPVWLRLPGFDGQTVSLFSAGPVHSVPSFVYFWGLAHGGYQHGSLDGWMETRCLIPGGPLPVCALGSWVRARSQCQASSVAQASQSPRFVAGELWRGYFLELGREHSCLKSEQLCFRSHVGGGEEEVPRLLRHAEDSSEASLFQSLQTR